MAISRNRSSLMSNLWCLMLPISDKDWTLTGLSFEGHHEVRAPSVGPEMKER